MAQYIDFGMSFSFLFWNSVLLNGNSVYASYINRVYSSYVLDSEDLVALLRLEVWRSHGWIKWNKLETGSSCKDLLDIKDCESKMSQFNGLWVASMKNLGSQTTEQSANYLMHVVPHSIVDIYGLWTPPCLKECSVTRTIVVLWP